MLPWNGVRPGRDIANGGIDPVGNEEVLALQMRVLGMLTLLTLAVVLSTAFAESGVDSNGGTITPVTLDFGQPLAQWYFFYSSSEASSNSTISFADTGYGSGSNFMAIALPPTSEYYLISDSPDPFSAPMQAADLNAFDAYFNLLPAESASKLFNDTSAFSVSAGVSTPGIQLDLPTLYVSGRDQAKAFRVGLAQADTHFIFVIPQTSEIGMDGRSYAYQFFLPYTNNQSMTFYAFSIVPPAAQAAPSEVKTKVTPSIGYRWTYDGETLQIFTDPQVSISLNDVMGMTYNANSGERGEADLTVLPGKYTVQLSESGYKETTDTIYLPEPLVPIEKPKEEIPTNKELPGNVTVTRSPEGIKMCVGGECYFQTMTNAESDTTSMLSDLTCTGSLCELVDIAPSAFIVKHQLRRMSSSGVQTGPSSQAAFNIESVMNNLGRQLSTSLGSRSTAPSSVDTTAAIISILAVGLTVYWASGYWSRQRTKPRGGYG